MIDFGQVRLLTDEKRILLAKILAAVAGKDEVKTAQFAHEMGLRTKHMNRWIASRIAAAHFGAFDSYSVGELGGVAKWEENTDRVDPITQLYDRGEGDYFMCVRNCLFVGLSLRSLGLVGENAARRIAGSEGRWLQILLEQRASELLGGDRGRSEIGGEIVAGRRLPPAEKPDLSGIKL